MPLEFGNVASAAAGDYASPKLAGIMVSLKTLTGLGTYATGGYTLPTQPADVPGTIREVRGEGGGYSTEWDAANSKLKVMYSDYNAVADGPLIEVANTTDLSAVTLRVLIFSS